MEFYKIDFKPHLRLRITATLIDYTIFCTAVYIYIRVFGQQTNDGWTLNGLPALVVPVFWILYFVVTEAVSQVTPGHDICKLKVVNCGHHANYNTFF